MRVLLFLMMSGLAAGSAQAGTPATPAAPATQETPADSEPATPADGDLLTFADPEAILNMAKGYGAANLDKDSDGNPQISGRMEGVKYSIFFYGCDNGGDCRSIQFSTGYTDKFSIEKANEWNYKYRWVKAYESDGSNFRMDVDFKGGITPDNLDAQFDTWSQFIPTIKDFVTEK